MDPDVPLLIPEVNPDHLQLVTRQSYGRGCIITNPNCSTTGLAIALRPLQDAFGVRTVDVTTMQAISGSGYPGVASLDIIDNVIPYIGGEEDKMATEPLKLLGTLTDHGIEPADMRVSAQCNRVPVIDGHLACVKVGLRDRATRDEVERAIADSRSPIADLSLPSAPSQPLVYLRNDAHPQPRLHRDLGNGMTVSVGRMQACTVLDFKFVVLSHNTVRGAAGAAILNAEHLVRSRLCAALRDYDASWLERAAGPRRTGAE
jgi:aspartate-semialdehyde dehydrogenase